ncbi:ABC transporter family protein [Desulfosporosinus sp. OT]|nr:ABC transporter family protein [Desulfosporosinus sp. OT]
MDLLELVNLTEKANAMPKELSGGQKQRVAIARSLTMEPSILLCDEATSALDPNITSSILQLLDQINKDLGITIVIVTHQMEIVKNVCTKMAFLKDGILTEKGKVVDIFLDKPPALKDLIGTTSDVPLPKEGLNYKIISRESNKDTDLIYNLATKGNIVFSLISSNTDFYRNVIISSFIINVTKEASPKLEKYLIGNQIEYMGV